MFEVIVTTDAQSDLESLPMSIRARVLKVYERLGGWPAVSGAKPLRRGLQGAYRVRTGDYRVLFTVDLRAQRVLIFKIAHRRDVYE